MKYRSILKARLSLTAAKNMKIIAQTSEIETLKMKLQNSFSSFTRTLHLKEIELVKRNAV